VLEELYAKPNFYYFNSLMKNVIPFVTKPFGLNLIQSRKRNTRFMPSYIPSSNIFLPLI